MWTVNAERPPSRSEATPASGIRMYVLLWCSQWIAFTATALTVLVLGYNIFEDFHSLLMVAVAYVILYVPFAVLSPVAGAFVDRWGQRRTLLISNVGTLANSAVLVVLMLTGTIGLWPAIANLSIAAVLKSLQLTALESVVPLLVPKRHIARANGSRMMLTVAAVIIGPLIVGLLLLVVEPVTIIVLQCAAEALAILVVAVIRIPPAPRGGEPRGSLRTEVGRAYAYLRSRHGLPAMLWFLAAVNAVIAFLEVAASGSVYAFAGENRLAVAFGAGFAGMLVASIAMTIWSRPGRLVRGMLGAGTAFAVALAAGALRPSVVLMAASAFVALGSATIIMGTTQTMLHTKVEPHLLGRAIGLKNGLIGLLHMTGNVCVLALAAAVQSLVDRDRLRSPVVAAFVGDGPGRGYAVLMLAAGVFAAVIVFLAFRSERLRRVQDDLPDVTPEDRPAAVAATSSASAAVL